MRQQNLDEDGLRSQVDIQHRIPRLLGVGAHRFGDHPAGRVNESVYAIECGNGGIDGGGHRGGVAYVEHGRGHAQRVGDRDNLGCDVPQRNPATLCSQLLGAGPADPGGSTGDNHSGHQFLLAGCEPRWV